MMAEGEGSSLPENSLFSLDVLSSLERFSIKAGSPLVKGTYDMGRFSLDIAGLGLDVDADKLLLKIYRNSINTGYELSMGSYVLSSLRVPIGMAEVTNNFLKDLGPNLAVSVEAGGVAVGTAKAGQCAGKVGKDAVNRGRQGEKRDISKEDRSVLSPVDGVPASSRVQGDLFTGASTEAVVDWVSVGGGGPQSLLYEGSLDASSSAQLPVASVLPVVAEGARADSIKPEDLFTVGRSVSGLSASHSMTSLGSDFSSLCCSPAHLCGGLESSGVDTVFSPGGDEVMLSLNDYGGVIHSSMGGSVIATGATGEGGGGVGSGVKRVEENGGSVRPSCAAVSGVGAHEPVLKARGSVCLKSQSAPTVVSQSIGSGGVMWAGKPQMSSTPVESPFIGMGEALACIASGEKSEGGVAVATTVPSFVPARRQLFPVQGFIPLGEAPGNLVVGQSGTLKRTVMKCKSPLDAVCQDVGESRFAEGGLDFSIVPGGMVLKGTGYVSVQDAAVQSSVSRLPARLGVVRPMLSDPDLVAVGDGECSVVSSVSVGAKRKLLTGTAASGKLPDGVIFGEKIGEVGMQTVGRRQHMGLVDGGGSVAVKVRGAVSASGPVYTTATTVSSRVTVSSSKVLVTSKPVQSRATWDEAKQDYGLDEEAGYMSFSEECVPRTSWMLGGVGADHDPVNVPDKTKLRKASITSRIPQLSSVPGEDTPDMSFRSANCFSHCSHGAGAHFNARVVLPVRPKNMKSGRGNFCRMVAVTTSS
jgi:hypothetical protein